MTELEKLYNKKKEELQNYYTDKAVYDSKVEEAMSRIKSYEKSIRDNAEKLRPDLRNKVLAALNRPDDKIISREYFENIRRLYTELERVGTDILNGKDSWNNENNS